MRATQSLGRYGEDVAARYLEGRGYLVLDRNWRSPDREFPGELDIVALVDGWLVFCEVKTRRSVAHGTPAESVTPDKVRRLRRLAGIYVQVAGTRGNRMRIDVICVLRPISGPAQITHLRGVA